MVCKSIQILTRLSAEISYCEQPVFFAKLSHIVDTRAITLHDLKGVFLSIHIQEWFLYQLREAIQTKNVKKRGKLPKGALKIKKSKIQNLDFLISGEVGEFGFSGLNKCEFQVFKAYIFFPFFGGGPKIQNFLNFKSFQNLVWGRVMELSMFPKFKNV